MANSTNVHAGGERVAGFSLFFASRWRITLIATIAILILGILSYTTFLKKEGFPSVDLPMIFVQTPYFVGDKEQVDSEVATPIVEAVSDIPEVEKINSVSSDNFSFITLYLQQGTLSDNVINIIENEIEKDNSLPANVEPVVDNFKASLFNGEFDLLLTVSAEDKSIEELQAKANELAEHLEKNKVISTAKTIELITEEVNPVTGQTIINQSSFGRIGLRKNGDIEFANAVTIGLVKKNSNIGTLELSEAIHEDIQTLRDQGELQGYDVTNTGDFAIDLRHQIDSLEENAITGFIIVLLVALLLINLRSAIVTAIFIPIVMTATFLVLYLFGFSLNTITLFALVLILGLFVDDATVVIEAIDYQNHKGLKGLKAIRAAVAEVGTADIVGTSMVLIVFAPILFISGVYGGFILQIPITVLIAMGLSLLFALTIIPFLTRLVFNAFAQVSRVFAKLVAGNRENYKNNSVVKTFNALSAIPGNIVKNLGVYLSRFVNFYLRRWYLTAFMVILSFILVGIGGSFAAKMKNVIFPKEKDNNQLVLLLSFNEGTSLNEAQDITEEVEEIIVDEIGSEIEQVYYFQGDTSIAQSQIVLSEIDERDETSRSMVQRVNKQLRNYDRATITFDQGGIGGPTGDYHFFVQVYGDDLEKSNELALEVAEYLEDVELTKGEEVTETAIVGFENISKNDKRRYIEVKAKVSDPENSALGGELKTKMQDKFSEKKLESMNYTEDTLGYDQGFADQEAESFESMQFAFIVAIILMFIIQVIQFNSYLQPLLILLAIPLTFPGLFPGLYLTDNALSFFVLIGITGLAGIVVNNTIMLVDFCNQGIRSGLSVRDAVVTAVRRRFRAITTTSLTTIAGLLPLAVTDPFWEGLALAMIFGLISSTIMVLTFFPAYFYIIESFRQKKSKLVRKLV